MSTDLRALLHDLAAGAPPIDNRIALADTAYTAGRRRRRVRHLEMAAAAAIVVIAAVFAGLFLGPSPLAAKYGASSSSKATGYPTHIGRQWPVLDLPAKPGPIAGVLMSGSTAWAVSPSGHRWVIPGDHGGTFFPTGVSADGRLIAYVAGDNGPLVIHDLITGTVTRVAVASDNPDPSDEGTMVMQSTGPLFSSDDRYVAFSSDVSPSGNDGGVAVIDVRAGQVLTYLPGWTFAGWSGDRLVTSTSPVTIKAVSGATLHTAQLRPIQPMAPTARENGTGLAVTADGTSLAILGGGDSAVQTVSRFDLTTGAQSSPLTTVPPAATFCGVFAGRNVVYNAEAQNRVSVIAVAPAGQVRTATTIDPGIQADCGDWASSAYDGSPHSTLLLDRLSALAVTRWAAAAWLLGGIAVIIAAVRLRRWNRRRASHDSLYPQFAREPWSRRRKVVALGVVAAPVLITLAVLTPLVFLPWSTGDLASQGPAVWWSPIDAASARAVGADGLPASEIPIRSGHVQGYLLRVSNRTGSAQSILGVPSDVDYGFAASPVTLTMSTRDGDAGQARSLVYAAVGTVPAHQSRWVRVLWTSVGCFGGGSESASGLAVRVKVGRTSRVEVLSLSPELGVLGPSQPAESSNGTCDGKS